MNNYFKSILFILAFVLAPLNAISATTIGENSGWVTEVEGLKGFIEYSPEDLVKAAQGVQVFVGDTIYTGRGTTITIQLQDDTVISVGENTKVEISEYVLDDTNKQNRSLLSLFSGRLRAVLNDYFANSNSSLTIQTESTVAGVKGSDISVWIDGDETVAAVTEGIGFIEERVVKKGDKKKRRELKAGYMASLKKGKRLSRKKKISKKINKKIGKLKPKKRKDLIKKFRQKKSKKINKKKSKIKNNKIKKSKAKEKIKKKRNKVKKIRNGDEDDEKPKNNKGNKKRR